MKSNEDKIYSLLGLATRAGKVVSGDDSTLLDMKKGRVNLVIVASDASDNTKKLFNDKCSYRKIDVLHFSTKLNLGSAIGKGYRAVIGIKDINFSSKIKELIEKE